MRLPAIACAIVFLVAGGPASAQRPPCPSGDTGLQLPPGFCATLFAESLATPRQMDVAANGDVFVGLNGQAAREGRPARPGGFIVLRDTDGDGKADSSWKFGEYRATTVKVLRDRVYTETSSAILRYRWNADSMTMSEPDTIAKDLPGQRTHAAKTFVIHGTNVFVNHGAPSNACQEQDRVPGSKGRNPCPDLERSAGIWRYQLSRTGQTPADGEHFASGIRNAVAMAIEPRSGDLYVMQHGRDQLSNNWPALFTDEKSAETPAEELFHVTRGADFGWPYCYFDPEQKKKVLAPEYGGDGATVGVCARKQGNAGFFPAHWAPNSLLFYTGRALPARYHDGAFIVFHGSWNRAPLPNQGFKVVFQPMAAGRAEGPFEVFVDGFSADGQPTALGGRPMALAQGPKGELYLSDDSRGRIWRITYVGTK